MIGCSRLQRVNVYFDMMLVKSRKKYSEFSSVELATLIEDDMEAKIIDIPTKKVSQLNIKRKACYHRNNPNPSMEVSLYVSGIRIAFTKISLNHNMIGVVESDNEDLSILFRIANKSSNDFVIHNITRYYPQDLNIIQTIGSGASGTIYLATNSMNEKVAIKCLKNSLSIKRIDDSSLREIIPLIFLPKHPCMIKLLGYLFDAANRSLSLVLEYAEHGSIDGFGLFSLPDFYILRFFYGLFSCVSFMHDYHFIHRDLNLHNILVSSDYECKIIDFGFSRFVSEEMTSNVANACLIGDSCHYDNNIDFMSIFKVLLQIFESSYKQYCEKKLHSIVILQVAAVCLHYNDFSFLSKRVLSEYCTLVENNHIFLNYINIDDYVLVLSKYHGSAEISNLYIVILLEITEYKNFDLLKLYDNICCPKNFNVYVNTVLLGEGIAFDFQYAEHLIDIFVFPKFKICEIKAYILFCYQYQCNLKSYFDKSSENPLLQNIKQYNYKSFKKRKYGSLIIQYYAYFYNLVDFAENFLKNVFNQIKRRKGFNCELVALHNKIDVNGIIDSLLIYLVKVNDLNSLNAMAKSFIKAKKYDIARKIISVPISFGDKESIILKNINIIQQSEMGSNAYINAIKQLKTLIEYETRTACVSLALVDYYYIKKKPDKVLKYAEFAAGLGKKKALVVLGNTYLLEKNEIEVAMFYYKKAANKGSCDAQDVLSRLNFSGKDIPKNLVQSFYYAYLANQKNQRFGNFILGIHYLLGINVQQDFKLGFEFLNNAKLHDEPDAIENLIRCYLYGIGTEVNIIEAFRLETLLLGHSEFSEIFQSYDEKEDSLVFHGGGSVSRKYMISCYLKNLYECIIKIPE